MLWKTCDVKHVHLCCQTEWTYVNVCENKLVPKGYYHLTLDLCDCKVNLMHYPICFTRSRVWKHMAGYGNAPEMKDIYSSLTVSTKIQKHRMNQVVWKRHLIGSELLLQCSGCQIWLWISLRCFSCVTVLNAVLSWYSVHLQRIVVMHTRWYMCELATYLSDSLDSPSVVSLSMDWTKVIDYIHLYH